MIQLSPVLRDNIVDKTGKLQSPWLSWFTVLFRYLNQPISQGGIKITSGSGVPNSAVTGTIGDLYVNLSGGSGTTLYVKESGNATNTGWVGK